MNLTIAGTAIQQDAKGRFSLNDLHKAAGAEDRHRPSRWLENQQTQELIAVLDENLSDDGIPSSVSVIRGGPKQGTYVGKELVYAYTMWINAKFHLKVIRTFDAVATGPAPSASSVQAPAKEFRALFGIAKLIGMDKNAAAISANQGVAQLTGTNMLALLGHVHLEAENQEAQFFTPTELGGRIGVSARRLNQLLAEAGFQMKRGDAWEVLDAGRDFARIYDTGKKHGSGVPIQQIKWAATVLPLLKQSEDA